MFNRLIAIVGQWARTWDADRIRVASAEGRWLRLSIGESVIIQSRIWKIEDRQLIGAGSNVDDRSKIIVQYQLVDEHEPFEAAVLRVDLTNPQCRSVLDWTIAGGAAEYLFDEDIDVVDGKKLA